MLPPLLFSTIEVTRQAFHRTALSFAIVNLKPLVPGHVLVCPTRPVPRLTDLTPAELAALMLSVQRVGRAVERAYAADALTFACQDGRAAGQTVPHVHFHVLPRKAQGDRFAGDDVYPALERAEGELAPARTHEPLRVDAEEDRQPRALEEMEREARWLAGFVEGEGGSSTGA
ncbi:HIT-like protein [Auriscalpium vulgare]|uniref:HIT-like protein n=1 Tax=Auriscalpium vulgare TaxID=40419 RepID=A0ACB8SBU9_9AGAM|nr:HIT-like protein [Auriscalpium vulgare]